MDEAQLLAALQGKLASLMTQALVGIGDDTAVLSPFSGKPLWTVDAFVEGTHFDWGLSRPQEVGWKALAVNLSDIAAMGGRPRSALVSVGMGPTLTLERLEAVYEGLVECAATFSVEIVGGNLTRVPHESFFDVSVLGEGEAPLLRSGAKPEEQVFVAGKLGEASAGLALLQALGREFSERQFPELVKSQVKPMPLVALGQGLSGLGGVTSLIDISDGLSSELHRMAKASGCGFEILEASLPISSALKSAAVSLHQEALRFALHGGEVYGLLGTVKSERLASLVSLGERLGVPVSIIGKAISGAGVFLRQGKSQVPLEAKGWDPFR